MQRRPRSPEQSLRLLQIASFTSSFDRFLIAPLIFVIAADLDRSIASVTNTATFYFLAYGVMQAVWAVVSDRLGRIRTVRLALALAALAGVASVCAPTLGWLLLARTLVGASFAAAVPGALVYVGDTVPTERRHGPLADLMTGAALGVSLASASAGAIGELLHWRVAFAVTTVIAGLLAYLLRDVPEPSIAPPAPVLQSFAAVLGDRWALVVLALAFSEGVVLIGLLTYLPLTLQFQGLSATAAGGIIAVYGVAVLVFARVVKRASDRLSPTRLISVGALSGTLAYVALVADQGVVGVSVGCLLLAAGWAFLHTTLQAWVTQVVPHARAATISLFAALLFCGSALSVTLGSGLIEDGEFARLYTIGLVAMTVVGLTAVVTRGRYAVRGGQDPH